MVGKSFGYHFEWDEDCGLGTHGYPTLDQAMWAAARGAPSLHEEQHHHT